MQIKAKDVVRQAITLEPNNTVYDSRNVFLRYNISRVVVAKDNKPLGIVTEKDISRFLYREIPNRRLHLFRLAEIMSKNLIVAKEEDNLTVCAKLMLENNISSIIVIDNNDNRLKGIFTKSDMVDAYAKYYLTKSLVKEYMTKRVITVAPDENLHTILQLMADREISRVVVTRNRKPVGIITGHDLLPLSVLFGTRTAGKSWTAEEELLLQRRNMPSGMKAFFLAEDIMKYDPITIEKNTDLAEAAQIMTRNGISGLPVIQCSNDDGNLVGIITKTDIIKALTFTIN
ncbi:MAG TPA: CBS domain-containing protein [Nitrososphaeraceae archaeon]